MTVKCLVWDLDNTLWDGVLSEDSEVTLNPVAVDLIKRLDQRGVLHSIASRNDHDVAAAKLDELGLTDYFLFPQVNWGAKSASVRAIAESLQFDTAAMAFVDDNPVERHEVALALPTVRCYDAVQVGELAGLPEFNPPLITEESARRRLSYLAASRRAVSRTEFSGTDDAFIRSLDAVMTITPAEPEDIPRLAELTARTTQMNATGIHYADHELEAMIRDRTADVLTVELSDRFGPYGKVGMVILARHASVWHLRLLATSCRIVPVGGGAALLNWLLGAAHAAGAHLVGDFRRTERNRMMEIAYRFAGFETGLSDLTCACAQQVPAAESLTRFHRVPPEESGPGAITINTVALQSASPLMPSEGV